MANKKKKFVGTENKPLAIAEAERARSNAWGSHADRRVRRARTRSASVRREIQYHS